MQDDRRYMSFEQRAAEGDERFIVDSRRITSKAAVKQAYKEADRIYIAMAEARKVGREAEHGSPEYEAAVAVFARHAAARAEIFARIRRFEEGA
jgi:hypothetical protein